MPLPDGVDLGTVTHRFLVAPDGVPDTGTVTFVPARRYLVDESVEPPVSIAIPDVVAELDVNGDISAVLVATDVEDVTPAQMSYRVDFDLGSGPRSSMRIVVPAGPSDLADLLSVETSAGVFYIRGPRGYPGLGDTQIVSELPDPLVSGVFYIVTG